MLRKLLALTLALTATLPLFAEEIKPTDWNVRFTGPGSGAQLVEEGVIAVLYRGYLLSPRDWNTGGKLSLECKAPEAVKADDGRTYGDHLAILIRSSGKIREKRSYEPLDGVVVRIDSVTGDIYVQWTKDGENFENYGMTKGAGSLGTEWHAIQIEDLGTQLTVSLDGKAVLTAKLPADASKGKVWGIYNREPVGPGKKVSLLRKIDYKSPPQ